MVLPLLALACTTRTPTERLEPSYVTVTLRDTTESSRESPLPFSVDPMTVAVDVTTLDVKGQPYPFDGDLVVKVRPGRIDMDPTVTVTDGVWSGDVSFHAGFGPTRIWFSQGDENGADDQVASWGVGVSDAIWFQRPTLAELQSTDDVSTNLLDGEFALVRAADREIVVTAREAAGMWVSDVMDAPGSGNGIYVYTFGKPPDELPVGARVTLLTGIDQEYLESTQLSYPTMETDGTTLPVPDAVELAGCDDDLVMEGLEGSRVRVSAGTIPADFGPGSDDYTDFEIYGQWPVTYGDCTIYVESTSTAPDFWPPDHAGETIDVQGMLKQIHTMWILVLVDDADLVPSGPAAPAPRPRNAR